MHLWSTLYMLLLNRAAVGWAVSCSAFGLFLVFFSFIGEQTQTPTRPIVIPVVIGLLSYPPSGAFCQVSKLTIRTEHGRL